MRLAILIIAVAACGSSSDDDSAAADAAPRIDAPPGQQRSLRFFGQGGLDDDRVKIRIDDDDTSIGGPRLDVGAGAFTVEFWMKAQPGDNPNPGFTCGPNNDWVTSNIIIDRDRHSQGQSYGIGIAGGAIVFAINTEFEVYTSCATTDVTDGVWHHVAAQRSAGGEMTIYINGVRETQIAGPVGPIDYPDDGVPQAVCPPDSRVCSNSDPFLVFGAEKHGYGDISYNGLLDEVRVSDVVRYSGASTDRPTGPFTTDESTVGLYHFNSGAGSVALDSAGTDDGPNDGQINVGGNPAGPEWSTDTPF